MSEVSITPGYR
jgi:hypothetical protein